MLPGSGPLAPPWAMIHGRFEGRTCMQASVKTYQQRKSTRSAPMGTDVEQLVVG